jgi:thiamine biosynthesis lipoprotein
LIIAFESKQNEDTVTDYVQVSHGFKAMGSPCVIHGFHPDKSVLNHAISLAQQEVERLEAKYSRFLASSELSKINQAAGVQATLVDAETAGLINYASLCFEQSDGLFDISSGPLSKLWDFKSKQIPSQHQIDEQLKHVGFNKITWDGQHIDLPAGMQIDFGGVVKEHAADCAQQVLLNAGIQHGLVDLAGDMAVVGCKPNNEPWQVGVRDPENPNTPVSIIPLSHGAIATSGYYERYMMVDGQRYCHILNPKTGWPVQYCATVSIVSERCIVSGSLATIAMLKQQDAVNWLTEMQANFFLQDCNGKAFFSEQPHPPIT